jgi:ribosomal protein S18 acetylase RimI-like enzyme
MHGLYPWIVCQSARPRKRPKGYGVKIDQVTKVNKDVVSAFARLIPQLSSSGRPLSEPELEKVIASPASTLLVARDITQGDKIVGTLTLVLFRIPTGLRAWIEDVVVDVEYRRQGVGTALVQAALERARNAGARTVDLTSRPSRKAANRLYRHIGFAQRETNVYRYTFEP